MSKTNSSSGDRFGTAWLPLTVSLVLLISVLAYTVTNAQTINPVRYYTFEGSSAGADAMGNASLNFAFYNSPYTIGTGGQVGKFLTLDKNSALIDAGSLSLTNGVTIEFLFKPGYDFNKCKIIHRVDNAFVVSMELTKLVFHTTHKSGAGATISDEFIVDLNGIGRKSSGYYVDGNWHHMVFKFDAATGSKQIWVDGQNPSGFSKTLTTGTFQNSSGTNLYVNHGIRYVKYHGSLDEIALYTSAIPNSLIYKHYLNFVAGQPYNFVNDYQGTIPAASSITGPIDPAEYAPGHPSVSVSQMDQIANYPVPRFKPGHTLMKNFNWMDAKFMGGMYQPGVTNQQAATNGTIIQTELAKNFNYYFHVEFGSGPGAVAFTNAANANPDFKLAISIFRNQVNGGNPEIKNQNKTSSHYLQNSSGQFLDHNGNVTSNKLWRPTAPISSYTNDGNTMMSNFTNLFSSLNRNIDLVNEGAELFPLLSDAAMAKDPVVTADKNASGLNWRAYLGRKFAQNQTQSFRDIFMTHPKLANAKFTEFAIEGYPAWNLDYAEARKATSTINGQYYPTVTFYTRYPYNWRNWTSSWHGWQWVVDSRLHELALGDKLYSPFVNAGWDNNEENNIRPAQWLGLLKCLGASGAEFYYAAFFSISTPYPDPKNWVWQAVIPSYAQAITSRYEDYLRNGNLMVGDVPNDYINPTAPGYSFWAGDYRKLVVARKHNAGNKYAITGTLQPNNNMMNSSENEGVATITLDGQTLSFKVRRQGSTYIYDKTNASAPVFYQLDGWHEKTHPSHWSGDFKLEAELFDNTNSQLVIKTEVPSGTPAGNYTNFTSYVTFSSSTTATYNFQPRPNTPNTLYLWVRARSRTGNATGFSVNVDGGTSRNIDCIKNTNWEWYRYSTANAVISYAGLSKANHELRITALNTNLEIDQIVLTSNSGSVYGNVPNSCSTAQATITANGPTTFCSGGSVVLTASSGSSYQWSNGATSQSITVTAAGTYTATVTSSGTSSVASPVSITVNPLPTATITTSGPTAICNGGSVTLTASSGASYLWSPGNQTSQSITVSAAGTYNVRVTNSNGCSKVSANTTVTVGSAPTATITAGSSTTFCQGGAVTLSASSGSSYLWSPGNQTTQSISVTTGGTYNVRVTNASGCSAVSSNTIVTVNSAPTTTITASGSLNLTQGQSVTLTSTTASSYLWLPGNQTTKSITVSAAGSYTVRVTNSFGCSATSAPAVVTVGGAGTPATITASGPTSFCQGGSVSLTANTGTAYLWSTGATTKTITASSAGNYVVTVTNNGIASVSPATAVTVWTLPTATITASGSTTICSGSSVTLTSSSGSSYSWSPGGQTTQSITVSAAGTYSVRVTNSTGCSKTSSPVTVSVNSCSTCTPPFGLTTVNVASNSATLRWTNPNTGQTEHQVKLMNMRWGITYLTGKVPASTTTVTVSASSSTSYRWWVRSWCGSTASSYAGYLTYTTPSPRLTELNELSSENFETLYLKEDMDTGNEIVLNFDQVQLFPNPAMDHSSLSFWSYQEATYSLTMLDINGRVVSTENISAMEGFNIHSIETTHLQRGVYLLKLTGMEKSEVKRLVIQ